MYTYGPGGWGARFSALCLDRAFSPPSLLYNGYRVYPRGKATGAWRWPPTLICRQGYRAISLPLPLGPRGMFYLYLTFLCQREFNNPVEWNLIGLRVFTQQYTSSTFVTWRFRSHKKQLGARKKVIVVQLTLHSIRQHNLFLWS